MRIKEVTNGLVLLALDPGDCLLLAQACGIAGDTAGDENQPGTLTEPLRLLAVHFEALALLGDAYGHTTHPRDLADWNLSTMRAAWGWLPEWREVAK